MYRETKAAAEAPDKCGIEFEYQAIVNNLRLTLGCLDRIDYNSEAGIHIQWAIDLIEQQRPHLKRQPRRDND